MNLSEKETAPTKRESGLELMRIMLMLFIIAHHYVVNSGVTLHIDLSNPTPNSVFLVIWGMWGKTAINAFVLITGYFMCEKVLTWRKVLKLWLQLKFYKIGIALILAALGMYTLNVSNVFYLLFTYVRSAGGGFSASFLMMYLMIPFLNLIVKMFARRQLLAFVAFLIALFSGTTTFFQNQSIFNEVFWYATLYLFAAYIRLYPHEWMKNRRVTGRVFGISVTLAYLSVVGIMAAMQMDCLSGILGKYYTNPTFCYYFVSDSCKLLAFVVGVSTFLFFKSLRLGCVPTINTLASVSFGVLLVHAHSTAMRQWLWGDVFHVTEMLGAPFPLLVAQAVMVPFLVYVVCGSIDLVRIRFLEKPLFEAIDRRSGAIDARIGAVVDRLETFVGGVM